MPLERPQHHLLFTARAITSARDHNFLEDEPDRRAGAALNTAGANNPRLGFECTRLPPTALTLPLKFTRLLPISILYKSF